MGALLIRAASRGSPQPCQLFSDFKAFSLVTDHPFPILGERLCWNLSWISNFLLKSLKGAAQGSAFQSCLSSHADPFSSLTNCHQSSSQPCSDTDPKLPQRHGYLAVTKGQSGSLAGGIIRKGHPKTVV